VAKKIGIYILTQIAKEVIKVAMRNEQRIKAYGGLPLWTLVQFLVAIAGILVAVIESGSNVEGDWLAPLTSLDSGTINSVQGAYAQFLASNGIEEGA